MPDNGTPVSLDSFAPEPLLTDDGCAYSEMLQQFNIPQTTSILLENGHRFEGITNGRANYRYDLYDPDLHAVNENEMFFRHSPETENATMSRQAESPGSFDAEKVVERWKDMATHQILFY